MDEKIESLLEELVKLKVLELKKIAPNQTELIVDLKEAGFGNSRIASLLGTTANTVNVTYQKAKTKNNKK